MEFTDYKELAKAVNRSERQEFVLLTLEGNLEKQQTKGKYKKGCLFFIYE